MNPEIRYILCRISPTFQTIPSPRKTMSFALCKCCYLAYLQIGLTGAKHFII